MNYLICFLFVIISIEFIVKINYINLLKSLLLYISKSIKVIKSKKISDHWKEKIIPLYSLNMLKFSVYMGLIFFIIAFLFFIGGIIFNDFNKFLFSVKGIIASFLISFGYLYIKNLINK